MNEENKRKKIKNELLKTVKREQTRNYIILYTVTLVVLVVLICYSFVKGFFSTEEFYKEVINNILGILPPLLIFDFFHEKLTRDSSAIEMSNQITETLMSNPETLELFTEEQRGKFIESAIASIVKDEDVTVMINDNLKNYLTSNPQYKIRTEFIYDFQLDKDLPAAYNVFSGKQDYFYVQEKLHYRVKYLTQRNNSTNRNEIKVGFMFDNTNLDSALRERKENSEFDKCIFRENLDIKPEDVAYLKSFRNNKEELLKQFNLLFKLDLQVDGRKGKLHDVVMAEEGIVAKMLVDHDTSLMEHTVRIIFHMPKLWNSILEVALVDPTKAPKISVSYPEDIMKIEMYSFLSKGEESALEVAHEHLNGIYDIVLNNEWIYPISGMIFVVNKLS